VITSSDALPPSGACCSSPVALCCSMLQHGVLRRVLSCALFLAAFTDLALLPNRVHACRKGYTDWSQPDTLSNLQPDRPFEVLYGRAEERTSARIDLRTLSGGRKSMCSFFSFARNARSCSSHLHWAVGARPRANGPIRRTRFCTSRVLRAPPFLEGLSQL
jgi:hypothetical protein